MLICFAYAIAAVADANMAERVTEYEFVFVAVITVGCLVAVFALVGSGWLNICAVSVDTLIIAVFDVRVAFININGELTIGEFLAGAFCGIEIELVLAAYKFLFIFLCAGLKAESVEAIGNLADRAILAGRVVAVRYEKCIWGFGFVAIMRDIFVADIDGAFLADQVVVYAGVVRAFLAFAAVNGDDLAVLAFRFGSLRGAFQLGLRIA